MHITSLPGPYGVGTMGKSAYAFLDFLHKSGQQTWQMLPLGPTGYGDSPYQSCSAYAGNPNDDPRRGHCGEAPICSLTGGNSQNTIMQTAYEGKLTNYLSCPYCVSRGNLL